MTEKIMFFILSVFFGFGCGLKTDTTEIQSSHIAAESRSSVGATATITSETALEDDESSLSLAFPDLTPVDGSELRMEIPEISTIRYGSSDISVITFKEDENNRYPERNPDYVQYSICDQKNNCVKGSAPFSATQVFENLSPLRGTLKGIFLPCAYDIRLKDKGQRCGQALIRRTVSNIINKAEEDELINNYLKLRNELFNEYVPLRDLSKKFLRQIESMKPEMLSYDQNKKETYLSTINIAKFIAEFPMEMGEMMADPEIMAELKSVQDAQQNSSSQQSTGAGLRLTDGGDVPTLGLAGVLVLGAGIGMLYYGAHVGGSGDAAADSSAEASAKNEINAKAAANADGNAAANARADGSVKTDGKVTAGVGAEGRAKVGDVEATPGKAVAGEAEAGRSGGNGFDGAVRGNADVDSSVSTSGKAGAGIDGSLTGKSSFMSDLQNRVNAGGKAGAGGKAKGSASFSPGLLVMGTITTLSGVIMTGVGFSLKEDLDTTGVAIRTWMAELNAFLLPVMEKQKILSDYEEQILALNKTSP